MSKKNDSDSLYPQLPSLDDGRDESKKRKSLTAAHEQAMTNGVQALPIRTAEAKSSKQATVESDADAEAGAGAGAEQPTTKETYDVGNEDEEEIELHDYTPDDKKKEVLRIFSWPDWAYYEILGVQEDATEADIKKAFHEKSKLTHTDRNDDVQAREVFQRVVAAYEILSNKDMRKEYNAERKTLKKHGQLVQTEFSESFESRAYENDFDEPEEEDRPMSNEKRAIIEEMGPFVKKLLNNPNDKEAIAKLGELNQKMINQNKAEGGFATSHCLPLNYFKKTGIKRERLMKIISMTPRSDKHIEKIEEAEVELRALHMELERRMEDLELPKGWTFDLPPPRHAAPRKDKGKGRADGQAPSGTKDNKRSDKKLPREKGGASSSNGKSFAPSAGGSGANPRSHADPMDIDPDWKPGETTRGEKILAYRPFRGWAQEAGTDRMVQTEKVNDFVIERNGENPIEIVSAARVGLRAVKAYLALPEEQRNCITYIDREYDRSDGPFILDIKGFARKFSTTGSLLWGVVLIDYDGEDRIINKSALKNALPNLADDMINDFLVRVGEEPEDSDVRLQRRLENIRYQLQHKDRLAKLRLAQRTPYGYDDSDSDSGSDLFVRRRRDELRRLTGRQTERPRVISDGRMQPGHRRKTGGHGERREQDASGKVVTRGELQSMMNQMMQQMTAQSERPRTEERHRDEQREPDTRGRGDVVTRGELQSMMNQMMQQMAAMRLSAVPVH